MIALISCALGMIGIVTNTIPQSFDGSRGSTWYQTNVVSAIVEVVIPGVGTGTGAVVVGTNVQKCTIVVTDLLPQELEIPSGCVTKLWDARPPTDAPVGSTNVNNQAKISDLQSKFTGLSERQRVERGLPVLPVAITNWHNLTNSFQFGTKTGL